MVRLTILLAALSVWTIGCSNGDETPAPTDDAQDAQVEQETATEAGAEENAGEGPALGDPGAAAVEDDSDPDRYATPPAADEDAPADASTSESEAAE